MDSSIFAVPYESARVFHSPFTYTFPITTGQKFLRLYFYPDTYSDLNTAQSFFSVTANNFTLFSNFSAFLYSRNTTPSFSKEFIINIDHSRTLRLTFSPNSNSFAFVNGIEIVSIPDKLYFKGNDVLIKHVDENRVMNLENSTALENLYRLNVGGATVVIQDDSGPIRGMFRDWSNDDDYILGGADNFIGKDSGYTPHREDIQIKYTLQTPSYSAPPLVYTSARVLANYSWSLEWSFPVDSGFLYLLRFHFCEFTQAVTDVNQRVFTISINGQTAEAKADIIELAGGPKIPIFLDFIKKIPDDGRRGQQALRLSLSPVIESMIEKNPMYRSALLNGLEIFKISNKTGSLAAANRDAAGLPPLKKKSGGSLIIYVGIGSVIVVLAVVAAVSFYIFRRQWKVKDNTTVTKSSWGSRSTARTSGSDVSLPSVLCRYFSIDEIKTATRNFDKSFVVGRGGFGNVYKGLVDNGATTVAIKRLNPSSSQGAREFLTEIQMLSKLRHLHLVSLIGYCDDSGEMILVYNYMAHGSLRDHLYNSENPPLSWNQRLQICMGAAKGLNYLHTGGEHSIIHRDVKSTNILLDDNWVAKISDFGLSKMGTGHSNDSFTHISTNVKGTFGYLDPKYLSTHQLTRKSDVYAFGVVLFEVLSGRPAVDVTLDEEQHSLAGWARYCVREAQVDQLIDPNLMGQISAACSEVYVGVAGRCIHIQPLERPTMADVVMGLELALTLQQTTDSVEVEEGDRSQGEVAAACVRGTGIERPSMNDVVRSLELALKLQKEEESEGGSSREGDGHSFMKQSPSAQSSDFSSSSSSDRIKSGDVFSEMVTQFGR